MRRSTEIRQKSNARSWKSGRIIKIARELENSQKQDEKELESFIEAKQSELDEWKEEEKKIRRKWRRSVFSHPLLNRKRNLTRKT